MALGKGWFGLCDPPVCLVADEGGVNLHSICQSSSQLSSVAARSSQAEPPDTRVASEWLLHKTELLLHVSHLRQNLCHRVKAGSDIS